MRSAARRVVKSRLYRNKHERMRRKFFIRYVLLFFFILPSSFSSFLQPLPVPQTQREENGKTKAGCALPLPPPLLRFRERPKRKREAFELQVRVRSFCSVLVVVLVLVIVFRSRRSLRVRCLLEENSPLARRAGLCRGLGSMIHSSASSSTAVATTSHCCLLSPFFLKVVKKMKS